MKIIAITVILTAVTACWTDKTSPNMPPPVANTAPPPTPPDAAPPPPPIDPLAAMPIECRDYGAAIHKFATCDKMPQASRDALAQAFDQASASWAQLPPEERAQLAAACKAALDAVTDAAKATCGP
jgi:hypothetical protein